MSKVKNIALALIAMVWMSASVNATIVKGNPIDTATAAINQDPMTVKYLGSEGEYLLFEVTVKSDDVKHTTFKIDDRSEGEIYTASVKAAYKVQTIKIEKREHQQLDFKLSIGDTQYAKSFTVLETVAMHPAK